MLADRAGRSEGSWPSTGPAPALAVGTRMSAVSRFPLLSNAQWALIEDRLPVRTGRRGRPFSGARAMVEGIISGAAIASWCKTIF